jgi:putative ABC transport system ATP-binding protein
MMLVCRELSVEYASGGYLVRPIERLDLELAKGELALLLGASGCGKTTLLSVLAAILRPSGGTAAVDGLEITSLQGRELAEYRLRKVGIVFQAFNLIPSLTASENVQIPLRASGLGRHRSRERADALLEQVGLADRRRHRPGDLSGGQQQRVAIARALALDPPLLLADEPTAHLDYIQVEAVLRLLREIADAGRIVVVATHDERLLPLADRVVAMSPRAEDGVARSRDVRLSPGEVLFRQGDRGDLVYVVEDGEVEIVRVRDDRSEELLARIGPGLYFGELAPIFGIRRSATARAAVDTSVVGLSVSEFRHRFSGEKLSELLRRLST